MGPAIYHLCNVSKRAHARLFYATRIFGMRAIFGITRNLRDLYLLCFLPVKMQYELPTKPDLEQHTYSIRC
jgi:hypothetical protein